ncbi:MAG: nuclear transport factor 2 family protein [Gaiellaceae bacterium]
MERSEEICRIVERWAAAVNAGDADAVLARLAEHPGGLLIGTDPNEWWPGEARHVMAAQMKATGGFPVTIEEIDAWEEGSCGWAATKVTVEWAGITRHARFTCVLHLERGDWKFVQVHMSLPTANETVGMLDVPTTLEDLEQTVRSEQPDMSASCGVDGTVTIVFTDIVDSTVMLSRLGDEAWLEVIQRHNQVIRDVTDAHGGRVVETQGDGSMLAFSSARRAVACAQALRRGIEEAFADFSPPIRIRIGIHTGDAIEEADHFFGTTVHYAARVAGQAMGGEVLVSSLVRDLVGKGSFLEGPEVELKGLEGRHRLYALATA